MPERRDCDFSLRYWFDAVRFAMAADGPKELRFRLGGGLKLLWELQEVVGEHLSAPDQEQQVLMRVRREGRSMPGVAQRNGYEQRQGVHWRSSTLSSLLSAGGEKVQLALPRSAISRKGNENYLRSSRVSIVITVQRVKNNCI